MIRNFIFNILPFGLIKLLFRNIASSIYKIKNFVGEESNLYMVELNNGYYIAYSEERYKLLLKWEKEEKEKRAKVCRAKIAKLLESHKYDLTVDDATDLIERIGEHNYDAIEQARQNINDKYI